MALDLSMLILVQSTDPIVALYSANATAVIIPRDAASPDVDITKLTLTQWYDLSNY